MSEGCIITTEEGKRWRVVGRFEASGKETRYLTREGIVEFFAAEYHPQYLSVVPVLDTVTFGGVVFERTGKMEEPVDDRWYAYNEDGYPFVGRKGEFLSPHELLRPVPVEGQGTDPT